MSSLAPLSDPCLAQETVAPLSNPAETKTVFPQLSGLHALSNVFLSASRVSWYAGSLSPIPSAEVKPSSPPAAPVAKPEQLSSEPLSCNGSASFCGLTYPEATVAGVHNASSTWEAYPYVPDFLAGFIVDQSADLSDQLKKHERRAFMFDVYPGNGTPESLELCHGVCALGSGNLMDSLKVILNFVKANEGTVITLIFQDEASNRLIWEALQLVFGASLYVHDPKRGWPTLEAMALYTPIIAFSEEKNGGSVDGLPGLHGAYRQGMTCDNRYEYVPGDEESAFQKKRGSCADASVITYNLWEPIWKPQSTREEANGKISNLVNRAVQERGRLNHIFTNFVGTGEDVAALAHRMNERASREKESRMSLKE